VFAIPAPVCDANMFRIVLLLLVDADEIRRLGKRFRKLDLDNSGALSLDEFLSLPELQQNPLVQRVIDIFDEDGNGEVDFKGISHIHMDSGISVCTYRYIVITIYIFLQSLFKECLNSVLRETKNQSCGLRFESMTWIMTDIYQMVNCFKYVSNHSLISSICLKLPFLLSIRSSCLL